MFEIGGNPDLNKFKDIPTSQYVPFPGYSKVLSGLEDLNIKEGPGSLDLNTKKNPGNLNIGNAKKDPGNPDNDARKNPSKPDNPGSLNFSGDAIIEDELSSCSCCCQLSDESSE